MPLQKLPKPGHQRLSLHPLKFEEAIAEVLKIKPEPKPAKKKAKKAGKAIPR
jgi:hypothetical protein